MFDVFEAQECVLASRASTARCSLRPAASDLLLFRFLPKTLRNGSEDYLCPSRMHTLALGADPSRFRALQLQGTNGDSRNIRIC